MKHDIRKARFHKPTERELMLAYIRSCYGKDSLKGLTRRERLARWGMEPVGRKHARRIRRADSGPIGEIGPELIQWPTDRSSLARTHGNQR